MFNLKRYSTEIPDEYVFLLKYARDLNFTETPDYDMLLDLFDNLFKKKGYDFDYKYDWVISKKK